MLLRSRFITAVRVRRLRRLSLNRSRGFTLLEIMIVLALIGLIASAIGVGIFHQFQKGRINTTQIQIREMQGYVQQYMIAQGNCPTAQDLVSAHYLRRDPKDPWGTPIVLRCPGEHEPDPADIVSSGPDKTPDTADDIKSWEL